MRFNTGILLAFMASANLAIARPVYKRENSKWTSPTAEAAYKTCAVAGATAYFGCRMAGSTTGENIAAAGTIAASAAEAGVKWSKTKTGEAAGKTIKGAATSVGSAASGAAKAVGGAASGAAKSVGGAASSAASSLGKAASSALSWATGKSKKKQGDPESQAKRWVPASEAGEASDMLASKAKTE